jgi:regulator of protease activity HflC (stomatin/prohibitin superfamily)
MFHLIKIRSYEFGLHFHDGEFRALLTPGWHWIWDLRGKSRVEVVSQRAPWLVHEKLDMLVRAGVLRDRAAVVDLKDHERALVWVDGRFSHILPPGLFAYWLGQREVRVEIVDARAIRFEHKEFAAIVKATQSHLALDVQNVEAGFVGVLLVDGTIEEILPPGRYAFWKNVAVVKLLPIDLREQALDIAGQDIMTADKVTLRLNALVGYKVVEPRKAVSVADDARQTLYREAQLALREIVGGRELDQLLADKEAVASELKSALATRAAELGLEVLTAGIRDVILPGDMKELFNKVTEAKKAAEANLIARREETAAIRSQANTAKLLAEQPLLMKLRELEALERIAAAGKLNVVLGDKGLADRVINLL